MSANTLLHNQIVNTIFCMELGVVESIVVESIVCRSHRL